MKLKKSLLLLFCLIMASFFGLTASGASAENFQTVPTKGMVTMLDLGATACVPCKMMAPIMERVGKQYEGY